MDTAPSVEPTPEDEDRALDRAAPHLSIVTARRRGLTYAGPGHIGGIPARDLTGPEVAAYITTRPRLLAVLDTAVYRYIPDPPAPPPVAAPAPRRQRPPRRRAAPPSSPPPSVTLVPEAALAAPEPPEETEVHPE